MKGLKKIILAVILITFYETAYTQCLLRPVSLNERIGKSSSIIEGRVTAKKSYWNARHNLIYTAYTIDVYKIFKGNGLQTEVEIITEGGIVGNDMQRLEPNLEMTAGEVGIFILEPTVYEKNSRSKIPASSTFRAYALSQGFVKYNEPEKTATDVFSKYDNITDQLYNRIIQSTGNNFRTVKPYSINENTQRINGTLAAPVISGFSPTTISAGTKSQLTINGNNFGAAMGTSTVSFKFADDGGASFYSTPTTEIVSWSNTQIVLYVPSKAGTGQIQVTVPGGGGGTATSTETLIVSYSNLNVNSSGQWGTRFINDNGSGGYSWSYYTGFNSNTSAKNSFERAFQSWRCATSVNWQNGTTTATNTNALDGINVVRFDIGSELPAGVLGQCGSYWSGCNGTNWYVNELDIRFDDGTDWYYGTGNPGNSQSDFESVTLHELGHGHQLGHVISQGDVMNYSLADGAINRLLNANNIAAGNIIMNRSTGSSICSQTVMTASAASNCSLGSTSDYRSKKNGSWSDITVWEKYNGTNWVAATQAPSSIDGTITIRNTDTVSVDDPGIIADQVVVDAGGELVLNSSDFTLNNGPGDDLIINGKLTWNSGQVLPQSVNASVLIGPGALAELATSNYLTLGCQFAIAAGGTMNMTGGGFLINDPGSIINDGTINFSGDISVSTPDLASLTNNGTINKTNDGILYIGFPAANNGIINIISGTISVFYFDNNNSGIFNIAANAELFNSGNFYFNGGTIQGSGIFYNDNVLTLTAPLTIPANLSFTNIGIIDGSGNLTINHDFTISGEIIGSGTFTINGNSIIDNAILGRSLTVAAGDTITVSLGQLDGAVLTIASGGLLLSSTIGLDMINNGSLINNGTMEVGDLWILNSDTGGSFINNGILITIGANALIFAGDFLQVTNSASGIIKGDGIIALLVPANKYSNSGIISPGASPGIFFFVGLNPLTASTKLNLEIAGIGGPGNTNGHDQIQKIDSIDLVLTGTLNVIESGTIPAGAYTIIESHGSKITGSFGTVNLPPGYSLSATDTTIILNKINNTTNDAAINFRSKANGNWNDVSVWEMFSGGNWIPATLIPNSVYGTINVRNTDTVLVNTDGLVVDQLTVDAGGVLEVLNDFQLNNGTGDDLTVAGKFSMSGINIDSLNGIPAITVSSGGNFSIGVTGNNPSSIFSSMTVAANGVLNWINNGLVWKGNSTIVNNGTFNINGGNDLSFSAGEPILTNNGIINKTNAGNTVFQIKINNNGTININAGPIYSENTFNNNSNSTINLANGTEFRITGSSFKYNGGIIQGPGNFRNADSLILNGSLNIPANLPFISTGIIDGNGGLTVNHDFVIEGKITGSGSLAVTGNVSLITGGILDRNYTVISGQNFYAVDGGLTKVLTVAANGTLIGQGTGIIIGGLGSKIVNNGNFNVINAWTLNGKLENNSLLTRSGTGVFLHTASLTNNANGIISGNGIIEFNIQPQFFFNVGTIAPGLSPGILTIDGNISPLNVLTTVNIEIAGNGGPGQPTGHDQLQRNNTGSTVFSLSGTLNVTETGTVPPGIYTIITQGFGTIGGTFTTVNLPPNYTIQYNAQSVTVTKAAGSCVPVVNISANPGNTICAGTNVTFTATPVNGGTSPSYQWKLNGNNVGIISNTYSSSLLVNGDIVSCVMTSNEPCANPTTAISNSIPMTVNPLITTSVSIAASQGNTVCAGTNVLFVATPTNGGTTPAYQWKLNGSNVGTNSFTYTNSLLVTGDKITCVMTSSINCPGSATVNSNEITMTVNPLVTPAISIAANPGNTICGGTNVTFTATPTNGGSSPFYQWKLNGNNVGTGGITYSTSSLTNGDIVTCVINSSANCASPITATSNGITMTVTPSVTPSISIAANPGNTICAGTNATFTATPTNGGTTPAYQWKLNGNNVGTNSTTYSNASFANGDIVTCVLTSNALCASPTTATSNAVTMTVNPIVAPSVTIAANPGNTICAGTNITFTATPINGGTPSYQWKLNGNNVGTNSNTYQNSALINGDAVTCVMISTASCISPTTATSNAITMTVTGTVVPAVSITANTGNSVCAGTNVIFNATPTNGGTTPTYQWKLNGNNVGANSNSYQNSSLVNGDIVTCVMTSSFACANPVTATSNAVTMVVAPNITPAISITANPGNIICAGVNVTFTATPTNGGTPSYQWKLNGNNVGTNSNTYQNASLANGDIITCVMTSSVICVTSTTATSNAITMTVTTVVTPSVNITANPGNSICNGTNVTFTAIPVNGGATPSYQWKLNGNNVGVNSNTYQNASLVNSDIVTCVMASSLTCITSATATSNAITMTVTANVIPSVNITANPGTSICAGVNVTFTATPVNGGITPSYQWKLNGNNVGTNSNSFSSSALANGDVVTCVLTSSLTCVTSSTAISNSITMSVTLVVTPTINIIANPGNTICAGTNVSFTATPANGGTPSYQWKLNGNNVGANSNTYSNATLVTGDIVTCVLTSSLSCVTSSSATSNTITMTVNPVLVPSVTIAANPGNTICAGTNVIFTVTPINGGATPSYQWKLNGNNVGSNSATYQINSLANGDAVTVIMTPSIPCPSQANATSNIVIMTVNPILIPSVSISPNPGNTICAGTNVTFTATPTNGGTTPSYQWKLNGNNVGANSTTYSSSSFTNSDVVTCVLTSNALCATPATVNSNAVTMNVNPFLTPSVSIAANPGNTSCAGSNVTFTATPTNGGSSPSYQWKLNGNNVGTNSSTYSNSALTNGDVVGCIMTSNANCLVTATAISNDVAMIITGTVVPTVSIAANPGNTICAGTTVTFTATPTNGGASPTYQWKLNGNNIGTNSITYQNSSLTNGDVVKCIMTSSFTCASPASATSNGITMAVNPLLTSSVSITANPGNAICAGTNVTFTATAANGGTPTYQWKLNGNNVGTNSATYQNSGLVNGDVVICIMTSSLNCASPTAATSNSITMTVTANVTPSVSIAANPGNTICAGTNVTFTATPTNGGATPAYQWKLNGNNVGTNSSTYSNAALTNGDAISCVMTSSVTCVTISTTASNAITMVVTANVTPSVSIAANTGNIICSGTNVIFTATPVNGGATPSYQWKLNGNNVGTNSNTYSNTALANGNIVTCVLTSSVTCVTSTTAVSNAINMTVNALPAITTQPTSQTTFVGSNVTLSVVAAGDGLSYQWRKGGVNIAGAIANSYTITGVALADAGNYDVVITGTCPPVVTSNTIVLTVLTIAITTQPTNQAACVGNNATFAVVANGTGLTYQWQVSTGGGPFTNITGATGSTLTLNAVTLAMGSNQYRCVVSGSLNSNAATLTVNPLPVVSLVLPFDTLYQNSPQQTLSGGSPAGATGVYSGFGVGGGVINPGAFALGSYSVNYKFTDANGCDASATDVYAIIANVDKINVYPNPSDRGQVTIVVATNLLGGKAAVYNDAGQKISEWNIIGRQTTYRFKWAAGRYTLVFKKGSIEVTKQIIVTR